VLDEALVSVQARGLSWSLLTPANFPLGDFAAKADWLSEELENIARERARELNRRGVVLLRGLPVERYDAHALKCIHYGIGCHMGTPVYQSASAELIGEITDEGTAALNRGTCREGEDKNRELYTIVPKFLICSYVRVPPHSVPCVPRHPLKQLVPVDQMIRERLHPCLSPLCSVDMPDP